MSVFMCVALFNTFFELLFIHATFIFRERQLRLEKVTATQRYIEDFKKQQAEWRRMERERMEAENRRILEYARYQQRREEDRVEKVKERVQAKETLHKLVHYDSHCHFKLFFIDVSS